MSDGTGDGVGGIITEEGILVTLRRALIAVRAHMNHAAEMLARMGQLTLGVGGGTHMLPLNLAAVDYDERDRSHGEAESAENHSRRVVHRLFHLQRAAWCGAARGIVSDKCQHKRRQKK